MQRLTNGQNEENKWQEHAQSWQYIYVISHKPSPQGSGQAVEGMERMDMHKSQRNAENDTIDSLAHYSYMHKTGPIHMGSLGPTLN